MLLLLCIAILDYTMFLDTSEHVQTDPETLSSFDQSTIKYYWPIQAKYPRKVTIIHQPENKGNKAIWAGSTQVQPSLPLWCCGGVVILHPDYPHDTALKYPFMIPLSRPMLNIKPRI